MNEAEVNLGFRMNSEVLLCQTKVEHGLCMV